jgi:hypothetical protein
MIKITSNQDIIGGVHPDMPFVWAALEPQTPEGYKLCAVAVQYPEWKNALIGLSFVRKEKWEAEASHQVRTR